MRNRLFPKWHTANVILDHAIENFWGVDVENDEFDESSIKVSFMNPSILDLVPREYRKVFILEYQECMLSIFEKLNLDGIFAEFLHEKNDRFSRMRIKTRIEDAIQNYNEENDIAIKDLLKKSLGVPLNYEKQSS